jgi:hypothetical protein
MINEVPLRQYNGRGTFDASREPSSNLNRDLLNHKLKIYGTNRMWDLQPSNGQLLVRIISICYAVAQATNLLTPSASMHVHYTHAAVQTT